MPNPWRNPRRIHNAPPRTGVFLLASASFVAPAVPVASCVVTFVEGLGPACARGPGVFEVFGSEGQSLGFTHGPDSLPSDPAPPTAAPTCVSAPGATDYYVQAICARAANTPDRLTTLAPQIRALAEQAQGILLESGADIDHAQRYRVRCVAGVIDVRAAVLPSPMAPTTFASVAQDLYGRGFTDARTKLWVWFDGTSPCACSGTAHRAPDSSLSPHNRNNAGQGNPPVAVTWARLARQAMASCRRQPNGGVTK